jgi:hypothetical protein
MDRVMRGEGNRMRAGRGGNMGKGKERRRSERIRIKGKRGSDGCNR